MHIRSDDDKSNRSRKGTEAPFQSVCFTQSSQSRGTRCWEGGNIAGSIDVAVLLAVCRMYDADETYE